MAAKSPVLRWLGIAALVAVLGLAAAGGVAWWAWGRASAVAEAIETVPVDRGSVQARVTASGTLSALVTVQVGAQVSGRLSELAVDYNSPVTKGQVLARLDPQLYQAAVDVARANLSAAQGNLAKATAQAADAARQAARAQTLLERDLIAQADADTARTTAEAAAASVQAAQGSVAQARAALHSAEVNLGYTTILSPIDGQVISRSVDVGQTVAASLSAPTLFVLAQDLSHMQVDTSVTEADIGKLTPGADAEFTVDAWPDITFHGVVRQVRNAATTVQNVVTYDAVIDVENPEGKLRPGMTANVTFIWAKRDDVLRIPNAALRFKAPASFTAEVGETDAATTGSPEGPPAGKGEGKRGGRRGTGGDTRTVWRLTDGKPERVKVKVGLTDGSVTEVVGEGLAEGDALITYAPDPEAKDAAPASGQPKSTGGSNAFRRGL